MTSSIKAETKPDYEVGHLTKEFCQSTEQGNIEPKVTDTLEPSDVSAGRASSLLNKGSWQRRMLETLSSLCQTVQSFIKRMWGSITYMFRGETYKSTGMSPRSASSENLENEAASTDAASTDAASKAVELKAEAAKVKDAAKEEEELDLTVAKEEKVLQIEEDQLAPSEDPLEIETVQSAVEEEAKEKDKLVEAQLDTEQAAPQKEEALDPTGAKEEKELQTEEEQLAASAAQLDIETVQPAVEEAKEKDKLVEAQLDTEQAVPQKEEALDPTGAKEEKELQTEEEQLAASAAQLDIETVQPAVEEAKEKDKLVEAQLDTEQAVPQKEEALDPTGAKEEKELQTEEEQLAASAAQLDIETVQPAVEEAKEKDKLVEAQLDTEQAVPQKEEALDPTGAKEEKELQTEEEQLAASAAQLDIETVQPAVEEAKEKDKLVEAQLDTEQAVPQKEEALDPTGAKEEKELQTEEDTLAASAAQLDRDTEQAAVEEEAKQAAAQLEIETKQALDKAEAEAEEVEAAEKEAITKEIAGQSAATYQGLVTNRIDTYVLSVLEPILNKITSKEGSHKEDLHAFAQILYEAIQLELPEEEKELIAEGLLKDVTSLPSETDQKSEIDDLLFTSINTYCFLAYNKLSDLVKTELTKVLSEDGTLLASSGISEDINWKNINIMKAVDQMSASCPSEQLLQLRGTFYRAETNLEKVEVLLQMIKIKTVSFEPEVTQETLHSAIEETFNDLTEEVKDQLKREVWAAVLDPDNTTDDTSILGQKEMCVVETPSLGRLSTATPDFGKQVLNLDLCGDVARKGLERWMANSERYVKSLDAAEPINPQDNTSVSTGLLGTNDTVYEKSKSESDTSDASAHNNTSIDQSNEKKEVWTEDQSNGNQEARVDTTSSGKESSLHPIQGQDEGEKDVEPHSSIDLLKQDKTSQALSEPLDSSLSSERDSASNQKGADFWGDDNLSSVSNWKNKRGKMPRYARTRNEEV